MILYNMPAPEGSIYIVDEEYPHYLFVLDGYHVKDNGDISGDIAVRERLEISGEKKTPPDLYAHAEAVFKEFIEMVVKKAIESYNTENEGDPQSE